MTKLTTLVAETGWDVSADVLPQLDAYCQALWQINEQLNLTRHATYEQFVNRDLLDTYQLQQLIPPNRSVLDIGSGGGVPGIVLAILRPDLEICLAESVGKKARALETLAEAAGVQVQVESIRGEEVLEDYRFDFATARAVGPLEKIFTWLDGHWSMLGKLLAIKGPKWRHELVAAKAAGKTRGLLVRPKSEYAVPGEDWKSVILEIYPDRQS